MAWDFDQPVDSDLTDLTLTAHWSKFENPGTITPSHGRSSGGETVTLTQNGELSIRLAQISSVPLHSMAIGSNGDPYYMGSTDRRTTRTTHQCRRQQQTRQDRSPAVTIWTLAAAGYQYSMALASDGTLTAGAARATDN